MGLGGLALADAAVGGDTGDAGVVADDGGVALNAAGLQQAVNALTGNSEQGTFAGAASQEGTATASQSLSSTSNDRMDLEGKGMTYNVAAESSSEASSFGEADHDGDLQMATADLFFRHFGVGLN